MLQDEIDKTLSELGFPNVKFTFDPEEAAAFVNSSETTVKFTDALRAAVDAFLHDQKGSGNGDSPAGFIKSDPEASALPESFSSEDLASKLREYLSTDPDAEIALLTPAIVGQDKYRFLPELGESITDNLVFRIILPNTLGILIWSIVDRTGAQGSKCYFYS